MNCDNHRIHYYAESKSVGIFHTIHIKIDILKYISIWSKIACNVAPVSTRRVGSRRNLLHYQSFHYMLVHLDALQ